MTSIFVKTMVALSLGLAAVIAQANDIEGVIERVDSAARTLTIQGITFHTTEQTDYDDGLNRFEDLRQGQRVEVDFVFVDGRHIATEIELED
jgi:hypothetical protein